jgi:hypothetical protein
MAFMLVLSPNRADRVFADDNLLLMDEAGFLRCERETTPTGRTIYVLPMSLTWQGHEFLEAARNGKFWRRAKALVVKKSGALSFDLLKAGTRLISHASYRVMTIRCARRILP